MTREQVWAEIELAFSPRQRPERFIRDSCSCDECVEHEADMQAFDPDDLPLEVLGRPAWDPICFASNAALAYLMPGLVKLLLAQTDAYIQQFVFHIEQPERIKAWIPAQARALWQVLAFVVQQDPEVIERNMLVDDLYRTLDKLDRIATDNR